MVKPRRDAGSYGCGAAQHRGAWLSLSKIETFRRLGWSTTTAESRRDARGKTRGTEMACLIALPLAEKLIGATLSLYRWQEWFILYTDSSCAVTSATYLLVDPDLPRLRLFQTHGRPKEEPTSMAEAVWMAISYPLRAFPSKFAVFPLLRSQDVVVLIFGGPSDVNRELSRQEVGLRS